jgi:MFS family permease
MAYGFSVFWLPLSRSIGIYKFVACPDQTLVSALYTTSCDWRVVDLAPMYMPFFIFLGSSAALWGGWVERVGPRKAGVVAAFCWCGGFVISAVGIISHQLWLMWLGSGVIGGVGLGLGYISPVSTLVKWFPDRRGMATGMAIMGFGGGAMIGSPLADILMNQFHTPSSVGHLADVHHDGRDLFCVHAGWRLRLQAAAGGLAARRLGAACSRHQRHDDAGPCPSAGCA